MKFLSMQFKIKNPTGILFLYISLDKLISMYYYLLTGK